LATVSGVAALKQCKQVLTNTFLQNNFYCDLDNSATYALFSIFQLKTLNVIKTMMLMKIDKYTVD
jgi:hypothetical protein